MLRLHRLEQSSLIVYALLVLKVSLVIGLSSRLIHVRKTFVAGPLSAPLMRLPGPSRVINSLPTYLLNLVA